ncbi:hypothetical protein PAXRUDRAFT_821288 [Paxillus rubicundulus Ve08.2h10]|uniref:Uncharacterized protein n=1 Tax=Paxillus rubicundulus Ve08.2h10 TaxID=930991 RepID=A0A0D0DYH9_9AGAM|nr:hypothetical protein PAXRUDRAFT_821288 [Paxillus rubicundulus Ve08.2h10]
MEICNLNDVGNLRSYQEQEPSAPGNSRLFRYEGERSRWLWGDGAVTEKNGEASLARPIKLSRPSERCGGRIQNRQGSLNG